MVQCTDFAASHCLSYVLTALSSHADDTRRLAYHCLRLYYDHVDAAVAQHHHAVPSLLLYLLDCVRYGVGEENERLPCIVTTFLARAAHVLTTPGTSLCGRLPYLTVSLSRCTVLSRLQLVWSCVTLCQKLEPFSYIFVLKSVGGFLSGWPHGVESP